MSVIAINGSPRPGGNTNRLMQEVITGVEQAGGDVKLFQLGQLNAGPCTGCHGCRKTAKCVVDDDMQLIYNAINSATEPKGLILGWPIYFDHLSAQMKACLDRFYAYTYTELGDNVFPQGFKAVLATTYADNNPHGYDCVLDWLDERMANYVGIETVAKLTAENADASPIAERKELLAAALEAGKILVC